MSLSRLSGLLPKSSPFLPVAIFSLSLLAANASNYLYHIVVGRLLAPDEFGLFGALFAPFYFVSLGAQALQTTVARYVAQLEGVGDRSGTAAFILAALRRSVFLAAALLPILLVLASPAAGFLKAPLGLVLLVVPGILVAVVFPLALGALQGQGRFILLGVAYLIGFGIKPVLAAVLVLVGLGVAGGLLALTLAYVGGLLFALAALRLPALVRQAGTRAADFRGVYRYLAPVLVASLCLGVPGTVDIVIVKHLFVETAAGLYNSALILGKIVLFLPAPVALILLPRVSARHARKDLTFPLLVVAFAAASLSSGAVVLAYWALPDLPAWVFGPAYAAASDLAIPYGLGMLFFALTGVFLNYNLGLGRTSFVWVLALFTLLGVGGLVLFNASLQQVVRVVLVYNALLLGTSALFTFLDALLRSRPSLWSGKAGRPSLGGSR